MAGDNFKLPEVSRKGKIDAIKNEVRHHCAHMAPLAVQMREFNPSLADELEKLLGKLDAWRRK